MTAPPDDPLGLALDGLPQIRAALVNARTLIISLADERDSARQEVERLRGVIASVHTPGCDYQHTLIVGNCCEGNDRHLMGREMAELERLRETAAELTFERDSLKAELSAAKERVGALESANSHLGSVLWGANQTDVTRAAARLQSARGLMERAVCELEHLPVMLPPNAPQELRDQIITDLRTWLEGKGGGE